MLKYKVNDCIEVDITEYRSIGLGCGIIGLILENDVSEVDYCADNFRNVNSILVYLKEKFNPEIVDKIEIALNKRKESRVL